MLCFVMSNSSDFFKCQGAKHQKFLLLGAPRLFDVRLSECYLCN